MKYLAYNLIILLLQALIEAQQKEIEAWRTAEKMSSHLFKEIDKSYTEASSENEQVQPLIFDSIGPCIKGTQVL